MDIVTDADAELTNLVHHPTEPVQRVSRLGKVFHPKAGPSQLLQLRVRELGRTSDDLDALTIPSVVDVVL